MADRFFTDDDEAQVLALFLRQAEAERAHDLAAMGEVLARCEPGAPDPVNFVARAYRFWGREAVLEHFRTVFAGTWRFEPEVDQIRIVPISGDAAHVFAPTRITVGPAGSEGTSYSFLVNEFAVRTPAGWRIAAIVPVPAQ
jgi:ketosteroid isomerase-like protein